MAFDSKLIFFDGDQFIDKNIELELGKEPGAFSGIGLGFRTARMFAQITKDYNNLTNLKLEAVLKNKESPALNYEFLDTGNILRATLKAGYIIWNNVFPAIPQMADATHVEVKLNVTGSAPTSGAIYVGIIIGGQGVPGAYAPQSPYGGLYD